MSEKNIYGSDKPRDWDKKWSTKEGEYYELVFDPQIIEYNTKKLREYIEYLFSSEGMAITDDKDRYVATTHINGYTDMETGKITYLAKHGNPEDTKQNQPFSIELVKIGTIYRLSHMLIPDELNEKAKANLRETMREFNKAKE